jgi:DNA-binding response OmpR family regulator
MAERKILIVDYDSASLDAFARLFEAHKFEVIRAVDGLSAYEKFKAKKPDLVLLEALLPKLHGFDLTRKISEETKGSVPVIIVTGLYRGPNYRHEAIATFGASEYFEKPVDDDKLLHAVNSLLEEEEEIWADLPSPDAVIKHLKERLQKAKEK